MKPARRTELALLVTAWFLPTAHAPLAAQACRGAAPGPTGWAVQALAGFTDHDGRRVGVRFTREWADGVAVTPELGHTTFDGGGPALQDVGIVATLDITDVVADVFVPLPPELTLCPLAGVRLSEMDDVDVSATHVGLSAGWSVDPGAGEWTLHSFLTPLAVWRMASVEGITETGWNRGLRGGVATRWRSLLVTVELERIWAPSREDRAIMGVGVIP